MNCPHCNYEIDAHMAIDDPQAKPSPGDTSMCLDCQGFLVFDEHLAVQKMSTELFNSLDVETKKLLLRCRLHGSRMMEEKGKLTPTGGE